MLVIKLSSKAVIQHHLEEEKPFLDVFDHFQNRFCSPNIFARIMFFYLDLNAEKAIFKTFIFFIQSPFESFMQKKKLFF